MSSSSSVPCRLWSDDKARGEPSVGVLPLRPILGIGCSVFSVLGCLYIIVTYRIRQSRKVYVDSVGRLVHVLAWLDFVGCVARILLEALKPSNPSQLLDLANVSASPDWFDPHWTAACEAWRDHAGQILCAGNTCMRLSISHGRRSANSAALFAHGLDLLALYNGGQPLPLGLQGRRPARAPPALHFVLLVHDGVRAAHERPPVPRFAHASQVDFLRPRCI